MTTKEVLFHLEAGGTPLAPDQENWIPAWVESIVKNYEGQLATINYIFCGDDYLHRMNVEYLAHDTLTDIITFPSVKFPEVGGDLFISTERVRDNASDFGVSYTDELHRVMIHGVIHLCGYGDKTEAEARVMRRHEEQALLLRPRPGI